MFFSLSRGFIKNVNAKLGSENALYRSEKGKITLTRVILFHSCWV